MFNKILIANRGEIACRVIKTARRMGVATVAVYSDADRDALHVRMADEAIHIGAAPARESYLLGDRILEAALATNADAIHPGYGFLSENAGFARACAEQGVVFIGPPTAAIEAMGSKSAAKRIMEEARCTAGTGLSRRRPGPGPAARVRRGHGLPGTAQGHCRWRRQGHAPGLVRGRIRRGSGGRQTRIHGQLR